MKSPKIKTYQLIVATFLLFSCFASAGEKGGNGGDMCEDRFKIVRDDISTWVRNGGATGLKLPVNATPQTYSTSMLAAIGEAKVSCTGATQLVGRAEKTCKNFKDSDGTARIVCNSERFLHTSESDQYVLVHHEYAGLIGLEVNNDEDSDYSVSNQLTGFLVDQVVKKLAVKPIDDQYADAERRQALSRISKMSGKTIRNRDDMFFVINAAKKYCVDPTMMSYEGMVLSGEARLKSIKVQYWGAPYDPAFNAVDIDLVSTQNRKFGYGYSYTCPLK